MILYHGSNVEVAIPRLIGQKRGLDFGAGFYLTSNKEQAIAFSMRVARRTDTLSRFVSTYEFDDVLDKRYCR